MAHRDTLRPELRFEDLQEALLRARALRSAHFAATVRRLAARLRHLLRPTPRSLAHAR